MEVTIIISALALIFFFFVLSRNSEDYLRLAFILAFGVSLITFGALFYTDGMDYIGAKNQTMIYSYNDFNFTTNQSTIANVTIGQNIGLVKTKAPFTDVIGMASIVLGLFVPIGAILLFTQEAAERKRKNEE